MPLPAETIRKAKASPAQETTEKGTGRQGSRQAMTSGENSESADSTAATAKGSAKVEDVTPTTVSSSTPEPASASSSAYPSAESYQTSSYSGSGYSTPSSYTRTEWAEAPPAAAAVPAPAPAPNGYSSGTGFSSGATATVSGAAAGLASSVSSAWQRRGSAKGAQARKPSKRQAMLTLARVEPWSVMKFSFVASVVAFVILFVAVAVLYMVLSALGVFDSLQNTVSTITSSQSNSGTNISHWFSASLILGYTALLGALNIVLITAMATVGSVIYNLIAKTIGGIEVTLRETD
jgi:hypothetical protein